MGWPEEGYVDLTLKGWWRAQSLTFRPREVHLGFPFAGHSDALTVFDREWLEAPLPLELDPHRILLPPRKDRVALDQLASALCLRVFPCRRQKRYFNGGGPADAKDPIQETPASP